MKPEVVKVITGPRPLLTDFKKVVGNKLLLDQLCAHLALQLKLDDGSTNELYKLLPRADHYDFFAFRKGEMSFEDFRLNALGIDRKVVHTRSDLIKQGIPLKTFIIADIISA